MNYDPAYLDAIGIDGTTVWNCEVLLNDQEFLLKLRLISELNGKLITSR